MRWRNRIILGTVGLLAGGCYTPEPPSLSSSNPDSKIPAIKDAAEHNDRTALPRLVEALNDDDPAIRFAAITALERMTGQTMGYRYYDDRDARRAAVQCWNQWLRNQ